MAGPARVAKVALAGSRFRASHGITGTSGEIASASLTSRERCGNWPWNPLMPITNGSPDDLTESTEHPSGQIEVRAAADPPVTVVHHPGWLLA